MLVTFLDTEAALLLVCCCQAAANEEEQEEEVPETRIEVEIPKINTDLGRQLHFVKLPNFLSVETRSVGYNSL